MALGCLLAGYLMDCFGRKITIQMVNVPFVIGWCIISMSNSLVWLLLGRILTGFCCGVLSPTGPNYLSEITAPKYRGIFLASITLNVAFGILCTHSLALYCTWDVNAIICGCFPFIGYIAITFVPESPSWLLRKNRIEEAFYAYRWLRGSDDSAIKEFQSMVDAQAKSTQTQTQTQSYEKCNPTNASPLQLNPFNRFVNLITLKPFNIPFGILSIYFATLQFSGVNAVIFYTVTILKESLGSNFNEYIATLVIDMVRLVAALIACIVVKNVGRRPLTIFSGTSTAICLFALSYFLNLPVDNPLKSYASIPLGLFVVYTLVLSIGINPLPWCLTGELFPLRFRAIGSAFVTFFNFLCFFAVVKTGPIYFSIYGSSKIFFVYGLLTTIGTIFLMAFLPETKNKSLQEIEDYYMAKRKHKLNRNKVQP